MRIFIDTETQNGVSVSNSPAIGASAPSAVDGGSAPASMDSTAAAVASPIGGVLTINGGSPSADLVAAVTAASGATTAGPMGAFQPMGASQPINGGPAPRQ